jgi:hypothetical protein
MPIALNCWVEPTIKLGEGFGVTAISERSGAIFVVEVVVVVDDGVDEQDAMTKIKAITNPIARK